MLFIKVLVKIFSTIEYRVNTYIITNYTKVSKKQGSKLNRRIVRSIALLAAAYNSENIQM